MSPALLVVLGAIIGLPSPAPPQHADAPPPALAQSLSCTPRRFCTQIATCSEAEWYYRHCTWGSRLDGDSDGIPCEQLCAPR